MKFKQSQKFRVICNEVSFFITARAIRDGVGSHTKFNLGLMEALAMIEKNNDIGCGGMYQGYSIQLSML